MRRLLPLIMMALICASGVKSISQTHSAGVPVRGRYSNVDYAFSVRVPGGVTAFRNKAPFPNHGFGIDLSKPEQSYLWVDASYNGFEWESLGDAVKAELELLRNEGATDVRLVEQTPTNLSTLRAVRFVAKYTLSGKPMLQESVIAFRREDKKEEIVYSINLRCPARRFERDRRLVAELQRAWELRRQP